MTLVLVLDIASAHGTKLLVWGQVALEASPEGALLLAFNDASQIGRRTPLTLSSSADHGRTWEEKFVLEDDLAGSFSYPTLLCTTEADTCFVIYTVNFRPAGPVKQGPPCKCSQAHTACRHMPDCANCGHQAAQAMIPSPGSSDDGPPTSEANSTTEVLARDSQARTVAFLSQQQHKKGCLLGGHMTESQPCGQAAAFRASSAKHAISGCVHELEPEPAVGMHHLNASEHTSSDHNQFRVGAGCCQEAAGQAWPCQRQRSAGVLHLGDSSWWYALYSKTVLRSGLQQPPACHTAANTRCSAAPNANPDAWGWTTLGMKVAVIPNALNN